MVYDYKSPHKDRSSRTVALTQRTTFNIIIKYFPRFKLRRSFHPIAQNRVHTFSVGDSEPVQIKLLWKF